MVRILTLKESCAQRFHQFLERCRALGTFDPQQSLWKLVLKQFLAQFYYWSINEGFARQPFARHIILFVASIMTIVAICIVQAPLPPPTGDKWRPVSKSQFLLWRSQESKSTVDILLRGWNAYGSSAGSPKKMTLVRMSARFVNVTHLILKWGDSSLKLLSFEIFVILGEVEANFLLFHILSALFCSFEKWNIRWWSKKYFASVSYFWLVHSFLKPTTGVKFCAEGVWQNILGW